MSLFKRITAALLAGCMTLLTTACGGSQESNIVTPADIQKNGKIVVGMTAEFAPYEFHAMVDGVDTILGFDMEIAKAIAADMGVELEIKELAFDSLLTALNAGQVDILISGLSATEKRREAIDFSRSYYTGKTVPMILKKNADQYPNGLEDVKGKHLGVQLASLQQQVVDAQFPDEEKMLVESMNTLMLALQGEQIDTLITSEITCKVAAAANPEFMILENSELDISILNTPGAAVGVRKGSDELVEQLDKTLTRLIDSGDLDRFVEEACEQAAANQAM